MSKWSAIAGAAIVALCFAGCARKSAPAPLVSPRVATQLEQFSGTPLSGPTTRPVESAAADRALSAQVRFIVLEKVPADALDSLGSRARLIAATKRGQPVLPSTRLTIDSRFAAGQPASALAGQLSSGGLGAAADIAGERGALLPGTTLVVRAGGSGDAGAGADGADDQQLLEVTISRASAEADAAAAVPGEELQLGLIVQDRVARPAPDQLDENEGAIDGEDKSERAKHRSRGKSPAPVPTELQREVALVDRIPPSDEGTHAAFIVPLRFAGGRGEAVAALIEVKPPSSDPDFDRTLARSMQRIQSSIETQSKKAGIVPTGIAQGPAFRTALAGLSDPARRRAALVFLADQTAAPICLDLAMVADDATLTTLIAKIAQALTDPAAATDRGALGWALDGSAFATLAEAKMSASDEKRIPPELDALLAAHAGEAGRDGGSLEEITTSLSGRQDLENRLIAENFICLEDNSPASRVRAYDWLRARNKAPEGYDPLASNRQRRDALERALSQPVEATPAAATQPAGPANGGNP